MEKIEKTTFSTKGGDPGSDNFWQIINWSVSNIVLCLTKVKRDKKKNNLAFLKKLIERKKILLEMALKRENGFFQLFFRSLFPLLNEPAIAWRLWHCVFLMKILSFFCYRYDEKEYPWIKLIFDAYSLEYNN